MRGRPRHTAIVRAGTPSRLLLIGSELEVFGVNTEAREMAFRIKCYGMFYNFYFDGIDTGFLVVHETGALRAGFDGSMKWEVYTDVVERVGLRDGVLTLDTMGDPAQLRIDVITGATWPSQKPRQRKMMTQYNCDVLKRAREYIAERYPFFDPKGLTPRISGSGDLREVTYDLPEDDALGGAPVVTINVRTCTVVRSHLAQ